MEAEDFTTWIQKELDYRKWDQAELARRTGITTAHISRIVSGTRRAGHKSCIAIAQALHIPPEEVFQRAGLLPVKPKIDPLVEQIAHIAGKLPEERQRLLLNIARTMLEEK